MTSDTTAEPQLVIWGTDVNVQEAKRQFTTFLREFVDDVPEEGVASQIGSDPHYLQQLEEVRDIYITCM